MTKNKRNNSGKDIMLEDIIVEKHNTNYVAYLALVPYSILDYSSGLKIKQAKFYIGIGRSKSESRDNLLDILIGHLSKLKSTKRFPL